MLEDFPISLDSKVAYRVAYREAARLAEMAAFDHGWGRVFAAGVGGAAKAIAPPLRRNVWSGRLELAPPRDAAECPTRPGHGARSFRTSAIP
jgi:hypothetical protein